MRGWDVQDARGVEVATYAGLYGEYIAPICKLGSVNNRELIY